MQKIICGDSLEVIKHIPDKTIDLVLTDPPYNIKKAEWDNIENYIDWCIQWIKECERVLKDTGSLYIWHNDMEQMVELITEIKNKTNFKYRQMCMWQKPNFRKKSWYNPSEKNTLRNWFNINEYCLYYIKNTKHQKTQREQIYNNPECYNELKAWYQSELKRLGLTEKQLKEMYKIKIGKKGYMFRHYFKNNQFEIPTKEVWNIVFAPMGFDKSYEELAETYKQLSKTYQTLRHPHHLDKNHCNVWISNLLKGLTRKNHICEKPVDILERIIRTSSREKETVLDLFAGSGSTGVACVNTDRNFIGIEQKEEYCEIARKRIKEAKDTKNVSFLMKGNR